MPRKLNLAIEMPNDLPDLPAPLQELQELEKLHVAFSGGSDSTALATWAKWHYKEIVLLHFNHGWAASDGIQSHCEKSAKKLGLTIEVGHAKSPCPTETMARNERYAFFDDVMPHGGTLALGHNLEEQIETAIFQISRGTENPGMRKLSRRNKCGGKKYNLYRPFLATTKGTLAQICKTNGVEWFEDPTNAETANSHRNLIRHTVLPTIAKVNSKALLHWSEFLCANRKETTSTASQITGQNVIDFRDLDQFNNSELATVLANWCKRQEVQISRSHVRSCIEVARGARTAWPLPGNKILRRSKGKLFIAELLSAPRKCTNQTVLLNTR